MVATIRRHHIYYYEEVRSFIKTFNVETETTTAQMSDISNFVPLKNLSVLRLNFHSIF